MKHICRFQFKIFFFLLFLISNVFSQTNIKAEMRKQNPIDKNSTLNDFEKIKVHKQFLSRAKAEKNITNQFYGYLYLFVDYYFTNDYVNMNKCLLDAEVIANKTNNVSWKGIINMRKAMAFGIKEDRENAIKYFFKAYENCKTVKDSLCMGESLEQISAKYKELDNYEKAHYYYKQAIPILSKYADSYQMALTYNNYSNLLNHEENYIESQKYIDSAISMAQKNNDLYKVMLYSNNKATIYTSTKEFSKAIDIYKEGEIVNKKNKFTDMLMYNYIGQSELYTAKGNYQLANEYLKKYYFLKDSLNGVEINLKIADLEAKYENQKKEASLKKAQLELSKSDRKIERIYALIFFSGILLIVLVYSLIKKVKISKKEIQINKSNLLEVKNLLIKKNEMLLKKEHELKSLLSQKEIEEEIKSFEIYNLRILTESDWSSFKKYFEKIHPNYIEKVRSTYPKITEAEERLFLCIKLNLKSKEIASILGISNESVKKNRNRLRKKINLNIEDDLEVFVRNFQRQSILLNH